MGLLHSDPYDDVSQEHNLTSDMVIGSDRSPLVSLSSHDWLIDKLPPWNQTHSISGDVAEESFGAIEVERDGLYEISLRRWPVEADQGINDGTYGKAFNYSRPACASATLTKPRRFRQAQRKSPSGYH